jgi:hypothetical protein
VVTSSFYLVDFVCNLHVLVDLRLVVSSIAIK